MTTQSDCRFVSHSGRVAVRTRLQIGIAARLRGQADTLTILRVTSNPSGMQGDSVHRAAKTP